jgi:hypothetical protein
MLELVKALVLQLVPVKVKVLDLRLGLGTEKGLEWD